MAVRSHRSTLLAFAMVFVAQAAPVMARAPLCRDGKGLYTPCPTMRTVRSTPSSAPHAASNTPSAAIVTPVAPKPQTQPVAHHRAKLCRDGKGLYTPCTR